MTTAAKRARRQRGQSLVEFAFLLPVLITMIMVLREVNMAINSAIVNQKYSRSMMHYLFFNHRWYPELSFIYQGRSDDNIMRRWWVGVNKLLTEQDGSPEAPEIKVGRFPGRDDEVVWSGDDVTSRQKVRVRALSFTCLPPRGSKQSEAYSMRMHPEAYLPPLKFSFCNDRF